jgi:hypothetical protein
VSKPVYVPIALPLAETQEVFAATRAVFNTAVALGEAKAERTGRLARGMVALAEAIDKARGTDEEQS